MRQILTTCGLAAICVLMNACSTVNYTTPGEAANLNMIDDVQLREGFETEAASSFPARIVAVRIQESGYRSYSTQGYGSGQFSVITNREVESPDAVQKIEALPGIADVGVLNRLLIPRNITGLKSLRYAASKLHADMLFIYTFDTVTSVQGEAIDPMSAITLGILDNRKAKITTTASSLLVDVRTGHVYGLAEATHSTEKGTNVWTEREVIDDTRLENEAAAFTGLVDEFAKTWPWIMNEYGPKPGELNADTTASEL